MYSISRLTSFRAVIAEFRSDGRLWILGGVAGGWFLSIGVRIVYPVMIPYLRDDLGISLTVAGSLLTVLWGVYAVGQIPGGLLADRKGSGFVLWVSTLLTAGILIGISISSTISMLFLTTVMLGLSTAGYGTARLSLLSVVFSDRSGTAIGISQAAGNLGNVVLPPIAGVIASALFWQLGFAFLVPLFVAMSVILWVAVPFNPGNDGQAGDFLSKETVKTLADGITQRSVLMITGVQVFGSFTYQTFTGFYPTYLNETKGLPPETASLFYGLFFATGILIQPLIGSVSDRFGERNTLVVVASLITITLGILPFVTGFVPLLLMTIALGSILGRAVLALTYLTKSLPEEARGSGLGFLRSGYILIGATGPIMFGALADAGYFDEGFFVLALVGGALLLVLALALPKQP